MCMPPFIHALTHYALVQDPIVNMRTHDEYYPLYRSLLPPPPQRCTFVTDKFQSLKGQTFHKAGLGYVILHPAVFVLVFSLSLLHQDKPCYSQLMSEKWLQLKKTQSDVSLQDLSVTVSFFFPVESDTSLLHVTDFLHHQCSLHKWQETPQFCRCILLSTSSHWIAPAL